MGAVLEVVDDSGAQVAKAISGTDGAFQLSLPPGDYRIVPQAVAGLSQAPGPVDVAVRADATPSPVSIPYDTGIR